MGYLLPIQPIQSQQYAERVRKDDKHYSKIERKEAIRPISRFADVLYQEQKEQKFSAKREDEGKKQKPLSDTISPSNMKINMVHMSPEIAQPIGKSFAVNMYV